MSSNEKSEIFVDYYGKKQPVDQLPNRTIRFNINYMLGYGHSAGVYPAKAYIINNSYETISLSYKKDKVVKLFIDVDENKINQIINEYELMKRAPHLGTKKPVILGEGKNRQCILIMNRLPGSELVDLVNQDIIRHLSINKKFELISKLFLAYYYQVYKANLVHRDIKPENIMVQITPVIEVNFCDYGLAKPKENSHDKLCCGTPNYVAPEVFYGDGHTSLSDLFSLARIITLILTSDSRYFNIPVDNSNYAVEQSQTASQKVDEMLSHANTPFEFNALIKSMLNPEPRKRPDIVDAINQFYTIFPQLRPPALQHSEIGEEHHVECLSIQKHWSNNTHSFFGSSTKTETDDFRRLFEKDLKTKGIIPIIAQDKKMVI